MSGSDLAYHLRPNKAIDRNLFIALLERIARVRNVSAYEYIGFGGPMLEDYKALHAALRINKMHSIEKNVETFKRQQFNRPAAFIKLHAKKSSEFFADHQFSEDGTIVWLDYTEAKALKSQLDELVDVINKLDIYDVVKITLNASVSKLGGEDKKPHERAPYRLEMLKKAVGDYAPADLSADDMKTSSYPHTLQRLVKQAVSGIPTQQGQRFFQILSSFTYADGQDMLTVCGIIFESAQDKICKDFIQRSRIKHWPFANLDWSAPQKIAVPALTAKERMRLDEVLPLRLRQPARQQSRLKRHLGYDPSDSNPEALAHYAKYYRVYPHFSRIVL